LLNHAARACPSARRTKPNRLAAPGGEEAPTIMFLSFSAPARRARANLASVARVTVSVIAATSSVGMPTRANAAAPTHADQAASPAEASQSNPYDVEHYVPTDLDHVRYTIYPHMSTSSSSAGTLQNLSGDLHEIDAQAAVPITANGGKTRLVVGLNYVYTRYALAGLETATLSGAEGTETLQTSPVPSDLHAITAIVNLTQAMGDRWSASVGLKPGLYSDLRVVDSSSFSLQGGAAFVYRASSDFRIGLGLSYQSRFGAPLLLPVGILDWHIAGPLRLSVTAPESAQLLVVPNDRVVLSVFGRVSGGSYRIHPDATLKQTDPANGETTTQQVPFTYNLSYSTISVGAGARLRIVDGLYAALEVPVALNRKWEADNLCWDSAGHTQCVDGPSTVNLANAGNVSIGATAGFEVRY
jgi:hypothetical protein